MLAFVLDWGFFGADLNDGYNWRRNRRSAPRGAALWMLFASGRPHARLEFFPILINCGLEQSHQRM